jgi:hypothetical protein
MLGERLSQGSVVLRSARAENGVRQLTVAFESIRRHLIAETGAMRLWLARHGAVSIAQPCMQSKGHVYRALQAEVPRRLRLP